MERSLSQTQEEKVAPGSARPLALFLGRKVFEDLRDRGIDRCGPLLWCRIRVENLASRPSPDELVRVRIDDIDDQGALLVLVNVDGASPTAVAVVGSPPPIAIAPVRNLDLVLRSNVVGDLKIRVRVDFVVAPGNEFGVDGVRDAISAERIEPSLNFNARDRPTQSPGLLKRA